MTKNKDSKYDKNIALAMAGFIDKNYKVPVKYDCKKDGDEEIHGILLNEKDFIPVNPKFNIEVKSWLMNNDHIKSFRKTAEEVHDFLLNPEGCDDNWIPIAEFVQVHEFGDSEIWHKMIFEEARRNADFKWKSKDLGKGDKVKIEVTSRIWEFPCKVGYDFIRKSYVEVKKCHAKELADFIRKQFLD